MSLNWLKYVAKQNNINILHAENGGEQYIRETRYKLDGYCKDIDTAYEFHGCLYHSCPDCFDPDKNNRIKRSMTNGELYQKTLERQELIKSKGYKLVVMWEHDWVKISKTLTDDHKK